MLYNDFKKGFPEYYTILSINEPGVGSDGYNMPLIKESIDKNESVIYITTQDDPEDIKRTASAYGIDIDEYEGKSFLFIDVYSSEEGRIYEKGINVSNMSNLNELSIAIEKTSCMMQKPLKIIFNSLSSLFLYNDSELVLRFVRNINAKTKTKYGLILYVLQDGAHDTQIISTLRYLVEGVIEIKFDEERERKMRYLHFKGMDVDSSWRSFSIKTVH